METPKTKFRSSASFGKRMEYVVVAELLKRDFDVYMTLVDDQQIDCILRLPTTPPTYVDIQIKARSKKAKYAGLFASLDIREPRENFVFIFYSEPCDTYWVVPSLDLAGEGNVGKSGKHKGKVSISFANKLVSGIWNPRPKFKKYQDNFDSLIPNKLDANT